MTEGPNSVITQLRNDSNRRASAQWRVRSPTLSFDISAFHFFRIVFETFAIETNSISNCFRNFCNRIEANSSSHFRAIFRFDFEFQSTQTWTQIRATTRARAEIEHKFEPQFELELKSNRIESS